MYGQSQKWCKFRFWQNISAIYKYTYRSKVYFIQSKKKILIITLKIFSFFNWKNLKIKSKEEGVTQLFFYF